MPSKMADACCDWYRCISMLSAYTPEKQTAHHQIILKLFKY